MVFTPSMEIDVNDDSDEYDELIKIIKMIARYYLVGLFLIGVVVTWLIYFYKDCE